MSADPPGTCHQVGCPDKGKVDHHVLGTTIGVPSQQAWATSQQAVGPSHVLITQQMAERLNSFMAALTRDPGIARTHQSEASILGRYLRSLLVSDVEHLKKANSSVWCHIGKHEKCSWPQVACVCDCHRGAER